MQIAHIANLWSLVGHPSPAKEWSLEKKIKAVADAGFDGITTAVTPDHRRLAEKHGLRHIVGFISTDDPSEFATLIRAQKEAGAVQINVQMDNHDTPPALATKHWLQLERSAEKIGGVVVKMNFDFSHLAIVKHLNPTNYVARLLDHPELVANSDQVHFRPFNGHHCQVPVTHRGALTPEVKSYLVFVEALMKIWKQARSNKDRTMFACPEMGPYSPGGAGYNITGLPPAWPDAAVLRGELQKAWTRA